jgi:CheY-like chemotaxis protein
MSSESLLKDKAVLIVDDEPDVLEAISELLDMCQLSTAQDYDTAVQLLAGYTFDIVILDIMGVDGFKLLKNSVYRGFPTVMLTAHALTPEALKESIKLGAVSFLPKEKMSEIDLYLEDVVLGGGKSVWGKLFEKLGSYFNKRFGADWKEQDEFFKNFEKELKAENDESRGPD